MKHICKKSLSILLVLTMVMTLFAGLGLTASAKTEGTISAETVTVKLKLHDGTTTTLASYTADKNNDTYKDSNGIEIPGVTVPDFENYGDGQKQGYILYTGSDKGSFARAGVVTKYVDLEILAKALTSDAYSTDTWSIKMATAGDGWTTTYGVDTDCQVKSNETLYSSYNWLKACFENNKSASGDATKTLNTAIYTDAHTVPAVLAITSYNERLTNAGFSGAETAEDLKTCIGTIADNADMANALRFFSGMSSSVTDGKFVNTGANSEKGASEITLIAPEGYIASGTGGSHSVTSASTANGSFTVSPESAEEGDTITVTTVPDAGYTVESVTAGTLSVTEAADNTYTFTMPDEDVEVSVTFVQEAPNSGYDWASATWAGGLDFSWYDENDVKTAYHITTPAQWEALAWICSEHLSDLADYAAKTNNNVTAIKGDIPTAQNTFAGVQFYLDNDIDMGGVCTGDVWSGPNYYPIGSQGAGDVNGNFYGSFYGSFDGQGHIVKNVYCNRGSGSGNQSVGLFGRIGEADTSARSTNPADYPNANADIVIENISVSGYIKSGRSVGGVVGKTLHVFTDKTITIRNCMNFASVSSSDSKGVGGVVGALWNIASVENCANFGTVTGGYKSACTGGIVGTNDGINYVYNSYNCGDVKNAASGAYAGAICGDSGQTAKMVNCYYLEDSLKVTGSGITDYGTSKTAVEMKNADFADLLSGKTYGSWLPANTTDAIYTLMDSLGLAGYPVPKVFSSYQVTGWNGTDVDTDWYNASGTEFTLSTPAQLAGLAAIVNGTAAGIDKDDFAGKTVKLGKTIYLSSDDLYDSAVGTFGSSRFPMTDVTYYSVKPEAPIWTPIGSGTASSNTNASGNTFAGTFDGQDNSVIGIYTGKKTGAAPEGNTDTVQGLFGIVSGTVKNVTVSGCITGKLVVGGIAAHLNGGTIENCINNAVVYADGGQAANSGQENGLNKGGAVGGIAGNVMTGSTVIGNVNNGAITCTNTSKGGRAAGIIGLIDAAAAEVSINKNANTGGVAAYQYAAGIVGYNASSKAPINACYNAGNITGYSSGSTYVGGITSYTKSNISNCYNTGDMEIHLNSAAGTKAAHFGGIVSDFFGTKISSCYDTGNMIASGTAGSKSSYGAICGTGYGTAASTKLQNCYALDSVEGEDIDHGCVTTLSAAELKGAAEKLGVCFVANAGTAPVLYWQKGSNVPTLVSVKLSKEEIRVGDTVTAEVRFACAEPMEITSFETNFAYSDSLLTAVSGTSDVAGATVTFNGVGGAAENKISFMDYSGSVDSNGMTVAALTFTAAAAGNASVQPSGAICTKPSQPGSTSLTAGAAQKVLIKVKDDAVTVLSDLSYIPTGYSVVKYTTNALQESGKAIAYDGTAMYYSEKLSDKENGKYTYLIFISSDSLTGEGTAEEIAAGKIAGIAGTQPAVAYDGDANEDKKVNIADAQLASDLSKALYAEGLTPCTALMRLEADVNGDAAVTAADARAIQYYIHYHTFELPA